MSYARFSDSDVYVFQSSSDNKFWCQTCRLAPMVNTIFTKGKSKDGIFGRIDPCKVCHGKGCSCCQMHGDTICDTQQEMIDHLKQHVEAGDDVGGSIQRLEAEIKGEDHE